MNNYEAVFIFMANLDNDAQEKLVNEIKGIITKLKGEVEQVQSWGKRKFTFLIKKQSEGIYCLVLFKLSATVVEKIENIFKLNDSILRVLIVRRES
ncbi:MAG: 30S ribosomal protein S6 [Candidatus Omnitrophica bacterium]|nr:30S ribosomal protein S6 [Candidatus Omnitrophota bacterium]